jgi:lipopolysaccharide biosynthesis protein
MSQLKPSVSLLDQE